jgi:hypothetical protein
MNDETGKIISPPIHRIVLGPEFRDLSINDMSDLAEGVWAANFGDAASVIHGFDFQATIALP